MRYDVRKHIRKHSDRFFGLIDTESTPNDCWLWKGTKTPNGYGVFCMDGQQLAPHRIVWAVNTDSWIPEGLYIRQRCENRLCCNPAHLFPARRAFRLGENAQFVEVPEWDLARYRKQDRREFRAKSSKAGMEACRSLLRRIKSA